MEDILKATLLLGFANMVLIGIGVQFILLELKLITKKLETKPDPKP